MAMYGIRFRGVHSRELGLVSKTKTRPAAPPVRTTEETILYRDGNLDYSEQGGRLFYDDKIVEVEFVAIEDELRDTNLLISKVVRWLCGSWGDLIFDDMPLVKWRAKPISLSEVSTELYRVGRFTVQFRCRPFNNLLFGSLGAELDSFIPLDTRIPLDWGAGNVFDMDSVGTYTFKHTNLGDVAARPKIIIVGDTDTGSHTITIEINGTGFTLKFPSAFPLNGGKTVVVDCEECIVMCGERDITAYLAASDTDYPDFPELQPGENTITVDTQITGQLQLDYNMPYLYGSNDLRGDDDA